MFVRNISRFCLSLIFKTVLDHDTYALSQVVGATIHFVKIVDIFLLNTCNSSILFLTIFYRLFHDHNQHFQSKLICAMSYHNIMILCMLSKQLLNLIFFELFKRNSSFKFQRWFCSILYNRQFQNSVEVLWKCS